jgi:hypothetical protein
VLFAEIVFSGLIMFFATGLFCYWLRMAALLLRLSEDQIAQVLEAEAMALRNVWENLRFLLGSPADRLFIP